MKICITGGAGFIGSKLSELAIQSGHTVLIIDRIPPKQLMSGVDSVQTDLVTEPVPAEVLDCDAIIHLAGANIFGRWTPEYKKLILDSRTQTAAALIEAVRQAGRGPKVFVSASAVGYYGDSGENILTEASPAGTDFLAQVCAEWEAVAQTAEGAGMRWVSVRTGLVMGPGGGMLSQLVPLFKLGLGGRLGSGNQWFSWVHLDDLLNIYLAAVTDDRLNGPVNAVAPVPVRNKDFTKALGRAFHMPAVLWIPGIVLRAILGEFASAILASQRALPEKLQSIGFVFQYTTIDQALQQSI